MTERVFAGGERWSGGHGGTCSSSHDGVDGEVNLGLGTHSSQCWGWTHGSTVRTVRCSVG